MLLDSRLGGCSVGSFGTEVLKCWHPGYKFEGVEGLEMTTGDIRQLLTDKVTTEAELPCRDLTYKSCNLRA